MRFLGFSKFRSCIQNLEETQTQKMFVFFVAFRQKKLFYLLVMKTSIKLQEENFAALVAL